MQSITPCLWFNDQAEEAVNYYLSVFNNSKIIKATHYGDSAADIAGKQKNSVMTINFALDEQEFIALNGGPQYTFTPAISLMVNCRTQDEVDVLWQKLSQNGTVLQCGWLTDKYGITWQIIPAGLVEMLNDPDRAKSERAMKAMLKMTKLDINIIEQAYNNDHAK